MKNKNELKHWWSADSGISEAGFNSVAGEDVDSDYSKRLASKHFELNGANVFPHQTKPISPFVVLGVNSFVIPSVPKPHKSLDHPTQVRVPN